jgi:RNA polymerase sigma factor for flagellar operon FliA
VSEGPLDTSALLERYMPIVRTVVERIRITLPPHIDANDLHSIGVIGLMAAIRRYTPEQDRTFAAYARTRIRGMIIDELRNQDFCGRRARGRARQITAAMNAVEQRVARTPSEAEVAAELGISVAEYTKWLDDAKPISFFSLDQAQFGNSEDGFGQRGMNYAESVADETDETGPEALQRQELRELVASRINELPEQQKRILSLYYFEQLRLSEIAELFSLTESRISQIHAQAILGLRAYLRRAMVR